MIESQRLAIRLSEIREAINTGDELSTDAMGQLRADYTATETAYRDAIRAEANPEPAPPMADEKPEVREVNELYHAARLTRMVAAIAEERPMTGAEAEFRAAVFSDGLERQSIDRVVPLHMFLPLDEDLEVRVDTASTVGASAGHRVTRPIADRVFARTDAAFLGANFVSVGNGQQRFPYVTAGASLTYADEGVVVDAQAGTVAHKDADPVEATLAYLIGMSSMLRFGEGEFEAKLRTDATMAITSGIDDSVILGRPAVNNVFSGEFEGIANNQGLNVPTPATDTLTAQTVLNAFASRVDGKYAYEWDDSRLLVRPEVYGKAIFTAVGGATGERLLADLLPPAMFRSSARLRAPSGGVSIGITYAPMNDHMECVVPVWNDVMVIVDPYSKANARQVRTTFSLAHNVLILRYEPWEWHSFKHT